MSGGRFEYIQYRFTEIYEKIQDYIDKNGKELSEEEIRNFYMGEDWFKENPEERFHHKYPDDIVEEFKKAVELLKKAQIYTQRIDWLLSDDDGEDSFRKRLKEDLDKL